MSGVKVGGVWKTPASAAVKVGGVWRTVATSSVKVGGVWRTSTLGSAPAPVIAYISTGVFEVTNTASTGVYSTPTLITGSGTANLSIVGSKRRYTFTNTLARFSLTYSYAAGAPQSAPSFMERKPYAYTCQDYPATCYAECNCVTVGYTAYCIAGPCPPECPANGQNGCGTTQPNEPCMCGSLGTRECDSCPYACTENRCDVLVNQPGYINSTTEWYKVT